MTHDIDRLESEHGKYLFYMMPFRLNKSPHEPCMIVLFSELGVLPQINSSLYISHRFSGNKRVSGIGAKVETSGLFPDPASSDVRTLKDSRLSSDDAATMSILQ